MRKWFSMFLAILMILTMSTYVLADASDISQVGAGGGGTASNSCSYGLEDGSNPVRKTDGAGKTMYISGNSINNKVFSLSEAPKMDYIFTFNNVTFSNYLKHTSQQLYDNAGKLIFVCKVEIGINGSMRSEVENMEFMEFSEYFNARLPHLSGYNPDSDLAVYKTNTPCSIQKNVYKYLDNLYIKPYTNGGRTAEGYWAKGLTWTFEKDPSKVRSNGTYLATHYIRVDEPNKTSYFEVVVKDSTDYKGKKVVETGDNNQQGQQQTVTYPTVTTAKPTTSKILINGKEVKFEAYNINDNNYFKLRDVALALRGTEKQFEVIWNPSYREDGVRGAIEMKSYSPYTTVGGEMQLGNGYNKTAKLTNSPILKDGVKVIKLVGYNISDNNFFKLRDLGELFDFNVSWDGKLNTIIINTAEAYDAST